MSDENDDFRVSYSKMHGHRTPPPKKTRRPRAKHVALMVIILVVLLGYITIIVSKPFAALSPSVGSTILHITTPAANLPWPDYGEGAFSVLGGPVIATHGDQSPLPTASAAKLVTCLVILEHKPLAVGASGPTITLTDQDVALYNQYVAAHGSVAPVSAGQRLSERQMLQAILLPSANNLADSLAVWAFGSVNAYLSAANAFLSQKGLTDTHVGVDASGLAPQSVSSASDLVRIGSMAMSNPTLADIVGQKSAVIPGIGEVRNVNSLLGINHIIGVKTGNNDQNGGVFVGAAAISVNGKSITIITALSGAGSLQQALNDSSELMVAIPNSFRPTTLVAAGTVLATYHDAAGNTLQAVASSNLVITTLQGSSLSPTVNVRSISYKARAGDVIGSVRVPATTFSGPKQVSITLKQSPSKPSLRERLLHP